MYNRKVLQPFRSPDTGLQTISKYFGKCRYYNKESQR